MPLPLSEKSQALTWILLFCDLPSFGGSLVGMESNRYDASIN